MSVIFSGMNRKIADRGCFSDFSLILSPAGKAGDIILHYMRKCRSAASQRCAYRHFSDWGTFSFIDSIGTEPMISMNYNLAAGAMYRISSLTGIPSSYVFGHTRLYEITDGRPFSRRVLRSIPSSEGILSFVSGYIPIPTPFRTRVPTASRSDER